MCGTRKRVRGGCEGRTQGREERGKGTVAHMGSRTACVSGAETCAEAADAKRHRLQLGLKDGATGRAAERCREGHAKRLDGETMRTPGARQALLPQRAPGLKPTLGVITLIFFLSRMYLLENRVRSKSQAQLNLDGHCTLSRLEVTRVHVQLSKISTSS